MKNSVMNIFIICCAISAMACTPQSTRETQTSPGQVKVQPGKPDPLCAKFSDSKAGEAALDAHVIYRDFMRMERYADALPYWRQVFRVAPAADGRRTTHFEDGATLYKWLLEQQESDEKKKIYLDSVLYMFDHLERCYPEQAYADGRKAFELYYDFRALTDDRTIFNYFTSVLDREQLNTPAFVINPFTALLTEMVLGGTLEHETAAKYAELILAIADKRIDDDENGWPIVLGYAPAQLDVFETVRGFYDCNYYVEKYYSMIDVDSLNCDDFPLIRAHLLWGECDPSHEAIVALASEYQRRCVVTMLPGPLTCGARALEEQRYQDAIDCYKEYVDSQEDPVRRSRYNLRIAKIYYGHLKNFPQAREYARRASRDRPNWGEPYLIIGKLYASSGPLCGPGRGWDSQIVTWPAIDMFERARQDPEWRAEADRWIEYYRRFMPSEEDIFQRNVSEGQWFFVGCWIQETTTIRAATRT